MTKFKMFKTFCMLSTYNRMELSKTQLRVTCTYGLLEGNRNSSARCGDFPRDLFK